MKNNNKICFIVIYLIIFIFCVSGSSKATLMDLGNDLIYDNNLNKVWFGNPQYLTGTWNDSVALLNTLPTSANLSGNTVALTWSPAYLSELNTLNFFEQNTRNLIAPLAHRSCQQCPAYMVNGSVSGSWEGYWLHGWVADEAVGFHPPERYYVQALRDILINLNTGAMYMNPDESDLYLQRVDSVNPMFAIANIVTAPEPSNILIILSGLLFVYIFFKNNNKIKVKYYFLSS